MSKFQVGDTWLTRGGDERTILCTNAPGNHPIVTVHVLADGVTHARTHSNTGHYYDASGACSDDLVTKVEPLFEAEVWVNPDGTVLSWSRTDPYKIGPEWRRIRVREVR